MCPQLFLPSPQNLDDFVALDQLCLGGLWSRAGYERELESPNGFLLGLRRSDSPTLVGIGAFWQILEEAHITLLMVHPLYQGRSLGKFLLLGLLTQAKDFRLQRATLEVKASNVKAINLYKKFGFQYVGTRRRYYADTGEDALIFWVNGLQSPLWQNQCRQMWQEIYVGLTADISA